MSIAASLAAKHARPYAKVMYRRKYEPSYRDVTRYIPDISGAITGSQQFGQPIAGCNIKFRRLPFEPFIRDVVEVTLGWDGEGLLQFTGFVTDPGRESFPKGRTVQCRDVAWVADQVIERGAATIIYDENGDPLAVQENSIVILGPGGTPNNVSANEVILRLLRDYAGIPEFRIQIPPLEDFPGHAWMLGTLSPLSWADVSPLSLAQRICDALGYWLYADNQGYIRAKYITGSPTSAAWYTFVQGENLKVPGPTTSSPVDTVYNRVVVTGANTLLVPSEDGTGPIAAFPVTDSWRTDDSEHVLDGKNRTLPYNNDFIEYVAVEQGGAASCEAVAARLGPHHSRDPFVVQIPNVRGDPRRQVGQVFGIVADRIGIDEQRNFFLYAKDWSFGGGTYTESLTLDGGTGPGGYTENPDPEASFTWELRRQTFNDVEMVEIFLTSTEVSQGNAAPLTDWDWTATGGNPTSGTGITWMTMYPLSAGSATITLVVTDMIGKISAPLSQTITFGDIEDIPAREINFAAGNGWYLTPDGGKTWRTEKGYAALCVPPIGAGGDAEANANAVQVGALVGGSL